MNAWRWIGNACRTISPPWTWPHSREPPGPLIATRNKRPLIDALRRLMRPSNSSLFPQHCKIDRILEKCAVISARSLALPANEADAQPEKYVETREGGVVPYMTEEWKWETPVSSHHGLVLLAFSSKPPSRTFSTPSLESKKTRAIDFWESDVVDE